jgi:tRNA(Ile)-lysidine synthase
VAQLAQRLALPFFLRVAESPPQGEAGARDWRYAMLGQIARLEGFGTVVTGHTASDRAETLLYNLARGSGLDGLAALGWRRPLGEPGLQAAGLQLVRPLLDFTREDTAAICAALGAAVWSDPVNQDLTYARNRIRHRVMPQLIEQINPRAIEHLAQTAELLEADVQYLERQAQTLRQQAETSTALNRRLLQDAPLALQRRAVRQFLQRRLPQQPNAAQIEKFVLLLRSPQGSQSDPFPGGAIARVEGDWVRLEQMS